MSTLVDQNITGLGRVQMEMFKIMHGNLNAAMNQMSASWEAEDTDVSEFLGLTAAIVYAQEPVDTTPRTDSPGGNFYYGHRPSLIEAPVGNYPNCAVMCERAEPMPAMGGDHFAVYSDMLAIEIMVKAKENEEDAANRRVHRMADAVVAVLDVNKTINGLAQESIDEPRVYISNLFTRREKTRYGDTFYWQGARIERPFQKESAHGAAGTGIGAFRNPEFHPGIDQG